LLSRAVTLDPDDANAHWALGLVFARMNLPSDKSEVVHELSEALKLNPDLSSGQPSRKDLLGKT